MTQRVVPPRTLRETIRHEMAHLLMLDRPGLAEAPRWFNRVAQWPPVRWLLPEPLARANAEVLALQHELRALWADWTPGATPVVLIQGMEDRLVWPQTADFAEARWPSQTLQVQRLEQAGHFVLWDQPDIVIEAIVQLAMAR